MNFQNLPKNWHEEPVDRPDRIDDLLDLLVNERRRDGGALLILICDAAGYLLTPCIVEDVPQVLTAEECLDCLSGYVQAIRNIDVAGAMLLAIGRSDGLSLTETDRRWRDAAVQLCGDDVRILGVHLITRYGTRAIAA